MSQLLPGNALGFVVVDIARLYRQAFEKAVVEAGLALTPGEIRALAYVARYEGSRQAVLAERMGVEPMTLSAYLDRLETSGLITRTVDPTDRRAKVIAPTKAAEQVFEEARPVALAVYERTVNGLDEEERKSLDSALQKMRANLTNDPQVLGETPVEQPLRGAA
ncbi:MAG TPA: MarR family transcriptional regulator [Aurantimonas sp.]|uniref:MarR family transcriptional regulator n=1 Tax=Aurantimonas marianensis TaxID=2920428 RepID=A0A9X2KFL4_9HYPH|nr:MarR family transcriptional regulator [Aurantimonas marianensis]MCP3056603.1 MarR family transcriptional regulator [Aurantimonas marianensis]